MNTRKKGNWIVRVTATVTKDVYCEDCTEEEAAQSPFNYATNEEEVDQRDYTVVNVTRNE